MDLASSAARSVDQQKLGMMPQVLPGIEPIWHSPAKGGTISVNQAAEHLIAAAEDPKRRFRAWLSPNGPTGARPKMVQIDCALQHFHGTLRSDVLMALWVGSKEGLRPATDLIAQLCRESSERITAEYQVEVLLTCLHTPNPYLEEALAKAGWGNVCLPVDADEKFGFWNVHLQVYVALVADHRWIPSKESGWQRKLPGTNDATVSVGYLRELGVDVDAHALSAVAGEQRRAFEAFIQSGGKKGKALPPKIQQTVRDGIATVEEAMNVAVATEIQRRKDAWKMTALRGKSRNLDEKNARDCAALEAAKAPAYLLSRWFTDEMIRRLPEVDPRYGKLLQECREAFRHLKERQIAGQHRVSLNALFNDWWRERQAAAVRGRDAERAWQEKDLLERLALAEAQTAATELELRAAKAKLEGMEATVDHLKAQKAAAERDGAKNAAWLLPELIECQEAIMRGERPTGRFGKFATTHASSTMLEFPYFLSISRFLTEASLPYKNLAERYIGIYRTRRAALEKYDELCSSGKKADADAYLKDREAEWKVQYAKKTVPANDELSRLRAENTGLKKQFEGCRNFRTWTVGELEDAVRRIGAKKPELRDLQLMDEFGNLNDAACAHIAKVWGKTEPAKNTAAVQILRPVEGQKPSPRQELDR